MPDPRDQPDHPVEPVPPRTPAAAPSAHNAWVTEHYGSTEPAPAPPPAPGPRPIPDSGPAAPAAGTITGRPWWNRGRTLAAAGVAAAILAVGAVGFGVGHAAASGPDGRGGTADVGRGPGGPGGRGPGH